MARKIVFVNGNGDTLTLNNEGPLLIQSIEGLGNPETSLQSQKAPFQDGTTYIDALLEPREIVVNVAITKPNDFPNMDLYRRELAKKLNPKYGQGTLTYTTENGSDYKIAAIPISSPTFANKEYLDPYVRAQITFLCNDPYWKKITSDSIDLPTSTNSAESVINSAASSYPSVAELSNGNLFVVYRRNSDNYLVSRTYTTSWSAEIVINSAASAVPSVIELSNGNLFVVYQRVSDSYLVSRTYTTSWSAESVINSAASTFPSVIELSNGNLFVVYRRNSDNYLVSRTYTTSWSAESVINSAASAVPSVIELSNGNLFVVYQRGSDGYLVSRTYTTSWSAESVINSAASTFLKIISRFNGSLFIVYQRVSDNYLVSRTYTMSWSAESVINSAASTFPSVIELSNGNLFVVYQRVSDSYLVSRTRAITPVIATVSGDYNTPIQVTFNGPSTNPRIINSDTLEYMRLDTTLSADDSFVLDTSFGNKTVTLTQDGIVKNGMAYLDIGSTFFDLTPGDNTIYYEDDAELSTATAEMTWTERYIGV